MILKEAYSLGIKLLTLAECNKKLEVRLLLQHVLDIDEITFLNASNTLLTDSQLNKLQKLIKLRNTGYPIAYILGYKYFWQDKFIVTEDVLIPRPETEVLIEATLEVCKHKIKSNSKLNILDIGVGSGCILLSLLKEIPNAIGVGVDISKKALMVTKKNANALNIEQQRLALLQQNLFSGLKPNTNFDIIVSNPPYIAFNDTLIEKSVKDFEPKISLFAKDNGFYFYREILNNSYNYLSNQGLLFLEAGINQKEEIVVGLSKNSKLSFKQAFKDYLGIDRVLLFSKNL